MIAALRRFVQDEIRCLRHAIYRVQHRLGCERCSSGLYVHTPLTGDPAHHLRILRPWKDRR